MQVGEAPLRIGVLGFGKVARTRFLPAALGVDGARVTAVGTRRPPLQVMSELPEGVAVVDYDGLLRLAGTSVDAVYIALPNDLHEQWVVHCAQAGLHVLCEKPLAPDRASALHCAEVCRNAGVRLVEAFMYRHDPRHQRARKLAGQGAIGSVWLLEATFSYPLEDLANIRLLPERLGGALMDVGCYGVDLARFLFEEEPVEAAAQAVIGRQSGVDELTAFVLRFPSDRLAVVTVSTRLAREHRYVVRGSAGTIEVPSAFVPAEDQPRRLLVSGAGGVTIEDYPPLSIFQAQIRHFVRRVRGADDDHLTENGVRNAEALERLRASIA